MAKSSNPPIGIRFRFNRLRNSKLRDGRDTILKSFHDGMDAILKDRSQTVIVRRLTRDADRIKAAVEKDLADYVRDALPFFFSQTSPNSARGFDKKNPASHGNRQIGTVIRYSTQAQPTLFQPSGVKVTRTNQSHYESGSSFSVFWAALSPATIYRKRKHMTLSKALTLFSDSGALKRVLEEKLGSAFRDILDFQIIVDPAKTGSDKAAIVRALPSTKLTASTFAALGGPEFAAKSSGQNSVIVSFLKAARDEAINEKLSNMGKGGNRPERPFIQPMLGFWLVNRFPVVFQNAVTKSVTGR